MLEMEDAAHGRVTVMSRSPTHTWRGIGPNAKVDTLAGKYPAARAVIFTQIMFRGRRTCWTGTCP